MSWAGYVSSAAASASVIFLAQHYLHFKNLQASNREDALISEVLDFWFEQHSKNWFLSAGQERDDFDRLISTKYNSLLNSCLAGHKDGVWTQTFPGTLALILVLDQFVRHIHREDSVWIEQCGERARFHLEKCLQSKLQLHCTNGAHLCFLLMPFRHELPAAPRLSVVLNEINRYEILQLRGKAVVDRFKRATESRASAQRQMQLVPSKQFTDEDLVENVDTFSLQSLNSPSRVKHAVYKRLVDFVSYRLPQTNVVLVSLSGGVDSMVILDCLMHCRHLIRVVCVHVDYGNRPESHAESDFLLRYCQANQVDFFVTDLATTTGLLRGVTDREEYEAKSREIRFDLYKRVWATELKQPGPPQVVVGHHQGDVVENVLSNAMKGKTLLELSGMADTSSIHNCDIHRPLLALRKDSIWDYSYEFLVPNFKDSTPRWSTRGQVRNELLPCLERIYGIGFPLHLAHLAEQSDELNAMLMGKKIMDQVVVCSQNRDVVAFTLDLGTQVTDRPLFLWKLCLKLACHEHGVLTCTDKAVKFLIDTLRSKQQQQQKKRREDATEGWFAELRRNSRGYVWANQYLVVFRIHPIPVHAAASVDLIDQGEVWTIWGGWKIRVRVMHQEPPEGWPSVTMDQLWSRFVLGNNDSTIFRYAILPSQGGGRYRILPCTSRKILTHVKVDLVLRQALLPVLWPADDDEDKKSPSRAIVECMWTSIQAE